MSTLGADQTVASVVVAELRRLLARGGARRWLAASCAIGIVSEVGSILLSRNSSVQQILGISWAGVVGTGPLVVLLVMSVAVANSVSREIADGTVLGAKILVPRPTTLFAARMAAWFVAVGTASLLCGVVGLLAAVVIPAPLTGAPLLALVALALPPLVSGLGVTLLHAAATVLQRGAVIVAVSFVVLLILPLLAAVGRVFLAGTVVGQASTGLARLMVGPLLLRASTVPEQGLGSWGSTAAGLLGVLLWWLAVSALAYRRFTREGFGDR